MTSISITGWSFEGGLAGLVGGKVGALPKAGELLQKAGTAVEAVGGVIAKPEGVEGLLKAASRVAKDEGVAKSLNYLSRLDPAINVASDVGKAAATGSAFGAALTLPSGDLEVIGGGAGGGFVGGAAAGGAARFLTKGPRLKEQLQNEWSEFQKQLTPEQIKNVKEYAPTLEEMGKVITLTRMVNGTTRGGGNFDYEYLTPSQFAKTHNTDPRMRGVEIVEGKTRPLVSINIGYRGVDSLSHELWHAMKRFSGDTELPTRSLKEHLKGEKKSTEEVEVLRPYLDRIQTILFGKRLNGKTVEEGMFSPEELISDRYDQYTSQMSPEARKAYDRQFEYDAAGNKLDPEVGRQKKLNKMMEEIEAESFRYLMSHATPQQIAQGNRSYKQRFIDHMLLSEHSKTLRLMRGALESVGIKFKPTGEPSDIFASKGKGITNSPELNAAFRQYLGAWEGMQYRTRMMGELEPSGFSVGGTGKAGRAQVEYALNKKENDFLRDHFSSSDILQKKDNGEVYYDPDGRVVLLTEGEIKKLQENRSELIREALSETDDGTGMVLMENGAFKGIPTTPQLAALDRIPNKTLTPNQKQIIRDVSDMMRNDPGAPIQFLYNAAIGGGKRYSSSLSSTHRTAVPLGFHVSKAQNFYFTALDLGAYHKKLLAWGDPTKKALHKGGNKLELWDKDVRAFEADLIKYLDNHKNDRKGAEGLDPDAQVAEMKRNVLNDFFDINRNKEEHGNFNPVTAARRAIDPKTGKQKKRAYRGLESLIRSYRLDRVLDENFGKSFSYALGKAIPMKSGAAFHEGQRKNLMPAPGEGSRITVKGEKSPVKVTDNSNSESITVRMYADDVDADFDLRAVEGEGGIYTLINGVPRQQLGGLSMSVVDKLFKKSGLTGRFVEFKESASQKTKGNKYVDSTTYGVFKGRPKEVLSELEKIVKPLVDSELVDSFEYSPTFKKGETVRLESGEQKKKTVQFESGLLNDLGVVRSMLPTLDKYPNLQRQLNRALGEMFSVETMKPPPEIPITKGNPIEAARRLQNTAEQSSYGRLMQAVVEMNDAELSKLNSLKSADDTSHFYEYGAHFMPAPTFYSKAERAVEASQQKTMSVDQAVSLATKGIPKAEYEWSGVVDWLEGRKEEGEGKVSKAELLEFLQNKGVKVEEVARGGVFKQKLELDDSGNPEKPDLISIEEGLNRLKEGKRIHVERVNGPHRGQLIEIHDPISLESESSHYRDIVEKGEFRLRKGGTGVSGELEMLTLPSGMRNDPTLFKPGESDFVMLPGDEKAQQSYGELVLTLPEGKTHETFELPSSHRFPESNILAHIRFTERVDADGKKMLFIEELQSDWSNEGRRDGWKQERPARVQKEIQRLEEERKRFHDSPKEEGLGWTEQNRLWWGGKPREYNPEELKRLGIRIAELEEKYPYNPGGAPDMPFKGDNRYGALAMKRMIRWASDNGFDRLGWITGKDTAERYNLSKHVDEVEYFPETKRLIANKYEPLPTGRSAAIRLVDKEGITPDQLEAHLGKDIAKKLLDSPLKESGVAGEGDIVSSHTLAGDDLAIGGQWAETLYDKVLPTQAKKIVKKKGAVGRTRLGGEKPLPQNVKGMTDSLENYIIEIKGHLNKPDSFWAERAKEPPRDLLTKEDWIQELAAKEGELAQIRKDNPAQSYEANYVDITPEVKALAEEGFSYFMPPGGGKGRAAAPAQPVTSLPATPIMPKVKLTDEEKEDSRRLLNLLKQKGI